MSFDSDHDQSLEALQRQLRNCRTITPALVREVIARACPRLQAYPPAVKAELNTLIDTGAWTDAVLTLLKLALPQWKLRQLVYDDGDWHCRLSKRPALPPELDDGAEAVHEHLALAMLAALVEARRLSLTTRDANAVSVPEVRTALGHVVCCDNFA